MEAGGKPGQHAGLGVAQVHVGHTDLGESQRPRPLLYPDEPLACRGRLPNQRPIAFRLILLHPPILETLQLRWPDEAACEAFARQLAVRPGFADAFIELHGPLGAGKTTFVRHLLRALGVTGRIKSPTYAVLEPHELPGGGQAAHFDFYRFADPREWLDAGFRDVFAAPGLKLAEWPDKVAGLLPTPDLSITLDVLDDEQRGVLVRAFTPLGQALLQ